MEGGELEKRVNKTAKTQFFFRLDERNGKIDVGSRVRRGTFREDFFF